MITRVKYTDLDNTQVKITLDDGREMFTTSVEGATWLHVELNEWLKDNTPLPFMTEEELAQKAIDDAREAFKSSRSAVVKSIKVTVGDKVFDGDETSQTRMARAIVVMTDTETVLWVLADNTQVQVTKAELTEALRLAGEAQTQAWYNLHLMYVRGRQHDRDGLQERSY
ncbi:MAG: hypothetical protein PHY48_17580 [Candidatus Cloacimonetes bacterium]|nr:hypothetical protein [Candidatus Cloacimonadota bacterium]